MKTLRVGIAGALFFLLVACASFDQGLATAYSVNTGLRNAASSSLEDRAISSGDAEYVLLQTRQNRLMLDTAREASNGGDLTTALGRLSLVQGSLKALRKYLVSKGVQVEN